MEKNQVTNSTEQRRKLLKGALAASSVVGLGYSSSSAAASITQCIQNQAIPVVNVVSVQFFIGANPPTSSSENWAWKKVIVHKYKENGTGSPMDGFLLGATVYRAFSPWSAIQGAVQQPDGGAYPKDAWVVVYFDSSTKNEIGAFPEYKEPTVLGPTEVVAQASLNCVNSLNPGIVGNYSYGG